METAKYMEWMWVGHVEKMKDGHLERQIGRHDTGKGTDEDGETRLTGSSIIRCGEGMPRTEKLGDCMRRPLSKNKGLKCTGKTTATK